MHFLFRVNRVGDRSCLSLSAHGRCTHPIYSGTKVYTVQNSTGVLTQHNQSPKFKRVSLNETLEFPFWGLNICVDFDLRNSQQMENMKKLIRIIFHYKHIDIHKTVWLHSWNPGFKTGFITIPCLKFWAQVLKFIQYTIVQVYSPNIIRY